MLRTCEQNPETLGSLLKERAEALLDKKEAGHFRARQVHVDCHERSCFARCGGGCRFSPAISFS
jgi:radical SAM protein with 4Fe4S-binding SPASM domain